MKPVKPAYKTEQEEFWAETYAEDYIKNNSDFDKELGCKGWETMLRKTEAVKRISREGKS